MFRLKMLLAAFAFLASSLACVTLLGTEEPNLPESQVTAEPLIAAEPTIERLISCPAITDQVMKVATSVEDTRDEELLDEEVYLVTYRVSGNDILDPSYAPVSSDLQDEQDDLSAHQKVWDYFTDMVPPAQRDLLAEYAIFTDGQGGSLAAVAQSPISPELWTLEVDIADTVDPYDLTFTLVHELGHLLTLGPSQVPPSIAVYNNPDDDNVYLNEVSACPRYFPGEGCASADSYVNAFYDQFWTDIYDEWNDINLEEDEDAYYERLDDFYHKYYDRFVTDYAATNPEEDMAESWAFFVLGALPPGRTISENKVLFFYGYPELVELRAQLLNNLCLSFHE